MDEYEKDKEKLLKLFENCEESEESDPFSDDGEYGDDPDYQPEEDYMENILESPTRFVRVNNHCRNVL